MKEMTLEEVKRTEVEVLDFIDSICRRHSITYYLAYGTLIGAVRHQGFIPWDDDIDIIMPRRQYHEFINVVESENSKYRIISYYNDKEYKKLFIKVVDSDTYLEENISFRSPRLGVYVDVFPLDYLPDNKAFKWLVKNKAWYLRQIMGHDLVWQSGCKNRGWLNKIGCFLCHLYGWNRAFNQFEKLGIRLSKKKTHFIADLSEVPSRKQEWNASCIDEVCYLPFEGREYPAPKDYSEFLKEYGDFMQLPPVEKRVSNHDFKAYFR